MIETLKAIVAKTTNCSATAITISLRPPLDHQSNHLYDVWAGGRRLIIKEFLKPDEFQQAPFREFQALERLAPLDIAPQPVYLHPWPTPGLGPLVIYDFMAGLMWNRHHPTPAELNQLAELWLKLNAIPTEGLWLSRGYERSLVEVEAQFRAVFETYAAWVGAEFRPGSQAAELCLALLEKRQSVVRELAGQDSPPCFCRADPRFANVIRRPDGRLGLVDWEDSGLRDPAIDLADLVTHPNQEDLLAPDEWQPFLQPYLAVRSKFDARLQQRMQLYLALFPIFYVTILIQRGMRLADAGQLATWSVNEMPINERLRRYLARGLAWPELDFSGQMDMLAGVTFFPEV